MTPYNISKFQVEKCFATESFVVEGTMKYKDDRNVMNKKKKKT
jgi:hypothetical protein